MNEMRVGYIGWLWDARGPGYKTVAWCDLNERKLVDGKAKHPHIAMYTDYRDMLRKEKLDAVFISTPNFVHKEQAVAFLDAGTHVFLEKPMGVNRAECDAVLQAATRNKRLCVIDFELRISPFRRRVQQMIDGGDYGALKRIEFIHNRGCWLEEGNGIWRTRPEKSGGMFFMEPIHEVDIFRQFGGEITAVQSIAGPNVLPQYQFEDNVCSHFFFKSGAVATLLTAHTHSAYSQDSHHWVREMGHHMDIIFTFEKGSLGVDMVSCKFLFCRFAEFPAGSGGYRVEFDRIEDYGPMGSHTFMHDIGAMHREFMRRLIAGEEPVATTIDAWKSHMVCLAAEQSVREEGRRVAVDFTLPAGVPEGG